MKTALVAYLPALHQGCINFITDHGKRKPDMLFLISNQMAAHISPDVAWLFETQLHAVPAALMQQALSALGICGEVAILNELNLHDFDTVIIPDHDEIVDAVMAEIYPAITPQRESWFIRRGKITSTTKTPPVPDGAIACTDFDRDIMNNAFKAAGISSDWWRQVGAILIPKNSERIVGFNHHIPHAQAPYIHGDPRANFKGGERIDLSTAAHAEVTVIGHAVRNGVSTQGASIYVTTFPCPACSYLIIESGIKTVYYTEGYSILDGVENFKSNGITTIFVDVPKQNC